MIGSRGRGWYGFGKTCARSVGLVLVVFTGAGFAGLGFTATGWAQQQVLAGNDGLRHQMERLPPVGPANSYRHQRHQTPPPLPVAPAHCQVGPPPAWIDGAGRPWWVDAQGFAYYQAFRDGQLVRVYRAPLMHSVTAWIERWSIVHKMRDTNWEAAVQRGVHDAVVEGFNQVGSQH